MEKQGSQSLRDVHAQPKTASDAKAPAVSETEALRCFSMPPSQGSFPDFGDTPFAPPPAHAAPPPPTGSRSAPPSRPTEPPTDRARYSAVASTEPDATCIQPRMSAPPSVETDAASTSSAVDAISPRRRLESTSASRISQQYEQYLRMSMQEDFSSVSELDVVSLAGTDMLGRPVVMAIAANLPTTRVDFDRLLLYCIRLLDPIVVSEYVLVLVNTPIPSERRPTFSWMKRAYGIFNRKYKKNLKQLFIVHANFWVKATLGLCRPFISSKFWRKVTYIDNLSDIFRWIDRSQITFPDEVMIRNSKLNSHRPVFSVSLTEVLNNEFSESGIPKVVEQSCAYLRNHLKVEGLFRMSGGAAYINDLREEFDKGAEVDLSECEDPHAVAGLLKLFLRELPDPLFTYDLYDGFIQTQKAMGKPEDAEMWTSTVRTLLQTLPRPNYEVLRACIKLMNEVAAHSDVNKMTPANLAIVFAPNMLKLKDEELGRVMADTPFVNSFLKQVVINAHLLFEPEPTDEG